MLRFLCAAAMTTISLYSCSSGSDKGDITLLKEVNSSLLRSNYLTTLSTNNIIESLVDKSKKPESSERATKWLAKAITIQKLTDSIISRIEGTKFNLIEEAGFDPLKEENPASAKQAVNYIFNVHKGGQLLHEKLALYKKDLNAILEGGDSSFQQHIKSLISITGADMITQENSFTEKYFNTSVLGAITMLNKIENDIRGTENKLTMVCNEQAVYNFCGFNSYSPIISQNTKITKPGDKMQILAGVGAFSTEAKPVITIAGKEIPLTAMGYSQYDFKASSKPGTNRIPVRIKYFDQILGKEVVVEEIIEYIVKPN
jgi:hypothetical protein